MYWLFMYTCKYLNQKLKETLANVWIVYVSSGCIIRNKVGAFHLGKNRPYLKKRKYHNILLQLYCLKKKIMRIKNSRIPNSNRKNNQKKSDIFFKKFKSFRREKKKEKHILCRVTVCGVVFSYSQGSSTLKTFKTSGTFSVNDLPVCALALVFINPPSVPCALAPVFINPPGVPCALDPCSLTFPVYHVH